MDEFNAQERAIIRRLQQFVPRPSARAYARMANTPWAAPAGKAPALRISRTIRRLVAASLIAAAAVALVWLTPPLRSLAQEVLEGLFSRAAGNTIAVEIQDEPTQIDIPPSGAQTFGSVAAAEQATGIDLRTPQIELSPFTLSGVTVNHEMHTVWLIYNAPGRYLSIYQRSAGLSWLDSGMVGADARVEAVEFESASGVTVQGEVVQGGWRPESEETAAWTTETTQIRLRWQDNTLVYEMVMFGDDTTRADDMMAVAASMR